VIIGALNIPGNDYDGHTLEAAIKQQQGLTGHVLKEVAVDRGVTEEPAWSGAPRSIRPSPSPKNLVYTPESKTKKGLFKKRRYRT
jgi:hypothetical protein